MCLRERCAQRALMGAKQPYGCAGAHMLWCVWHVPGTQRDWCGSSRNIIAGRAGGRPPLRGRPPFGVPSSDGVTVQLMWRDRSVIAPCLHGSSVCVNMCACVCVFFFFLFVRDSPAEWWRDLAHSSGRQGVEIGHVWSGVLPWHP